jgi:hypothetical protein
MARQFDYIRLKEGPWDGEVLSFVALVRGQQGKTGAGSQAEACRTGTPGRGG